MKIPPDPRTSYVLKEEQDRRILEKLNVLAVQKNIDRILLLFLYSQLETDWRTPLEEFIDSLKK